VSEPPASDLPVAASDDMFFSGRLRLLQPESGARAGLDAVVLAASVDADPAIPIRVLEAGTGAGVVAACLAHRLELAQVDAVEIEPDLCALARLNMSRNGLEHRVRIICGDVAAPLSRLTAQGVSLQAYDWVIANPPFFSAATARAPSHPLKERAHMMAPGALDGWLRFMAACAAPKGWIALVHRPDALPELLSAMAGRFGDITVLPLHPHAGESAHRLLIRARKASRAPLRLLPGLVVHEPAGEFMPVFRAVLRAGAALPWPDKPLPATK
jgi:tRNA1(Val) A37 N6-methylase TrmN6